MKIKLTVYLGLIGVASWGAFGLAVGSQVAWGEPPVVDSDGDGFSDVAERLWGCDPGDARSAPKHTHGLVASWRLDEGAGMDVQDVSGNGRHGLLVGTTLPVWEADGASKVLRFDGVQNEVRVPDAEGLTPQEFTVMAWVKGAARADGVIVGKWDTETKGSYSLALLNGRPVMELSLNGVYVPFSTAVVMPDDGWHHLAGSYTGGEARLYLDGRRVATTHIGGSVDHIIGPLVMGQGAGYLADVQLFNRALSDGQIGFFWLSGTGEHPPLKKGAQLKRPLDDSISLEKRLVALRKSGDRRNAKLAPDSPTAQIAGVK